LLATISVGNSCFSYVFHSAGCPERVSAIANAIAFLNLFPHLEGTFSGELFRVLTMSV
jgi:hypothetical protein